MNVRYRVELSQDERNELTALLSAGKHAARKLKRAQILLAADAGISDDDIAISLAVGGSTVYRTKRRFVEGDLEAALSEAPRCGAQAHRQRRSPAGGDRLLEPARGPRELLAGAMVRLTEHEELSRETVRQRLAKNYLKPWRKDMWCIRRSTAPTSPAWRTCSTSTPNPMIRSGRSCASTRVRPS